MFYFCSASSILPEGSVGKTAQLHDLTCQAKLFLLCNIWNDTVKNDPKKSIMCNTKNMFSTPLPAFSPSLTHTNFFHPHLECLHVSTAQGSPLCTSHQHKQKESHIKPSTTKTHEKKAWAQKHLSKYRWHERKKPAQPSISVSLENQASHITCRHSFIPPPQTYNYFS